MRTRVKICGITRDEDARAAARFGADALGFVFWPKSPRAISPAIAGAIGVAVPRLVTRVGVFVNAKPSEVARAVRIARLDVVQLHGDERPEKYAKCGAGVVKAVSLMTRDDVQCALDYAPEITLLVDVRDPVKRGGTGRRPDWVLARMLAYRRPILLAGGLDAASVGDAIRQVSPWGLDVSSGVETRPGIKSAQKIAAVCAAVAEADEERS